MLVNIQELVGRTKCKLVIRRQTHDNEYTDRYSTNSEEWISDSNCSEVYRVV